MTQLLDLNSASSRHFGVRIDLGRSAVALAGELDMATVPTLLDAATTLLDAGPADITVDLTELEFIDSQGLNLLEALKVEQDRRSARLVLIGVSSRVRYVFGVAGLEHMLEPFAAA